jgi:alkylation response protein AidB-like acyl-CoA dehydrogenase
MDFRLSPEDEQFRRLCSSWLRDNLPAGWGTPDFDPPQTLEEEVAFTRAWLRKMYESGWAAISWPREYGGRGASPMQQLIYAEEYARRRAPSLLSMGVGIPLVGPTLIRHGTEEQRRRFLPKILAGEELWCQGFSEPNAGSDLAGLKTRGDVVGDELVITGQKIWTSYAQFSQWCILLVRTDFGAAKHKGITYVMVDMESPGITIRPLVEMTGKAWFNEVFFDNVRVPRANVVGEINRGWEITMTTLGHERGSTSPHPRARQEVRDLVAMARDLARGHIDDPLWRQRLAQHCIDMEILRLNSYRSISQYVRHGTPGPEGSILKLFWSEADQRLKETALELQGPYALLAKGSGRAYDNGRWHYELLWSRAATIYAGTSEVQRNILAQRVLGLPRT